jgi:hypothetical protein
MCMQRYSGQWAEVYGCLGQGKRAQKNVRVGVSNGRPWAEMEVMPWAPRQ